MGGLEAHLEAARTCAGIAVTVGDRSPQGQLTRNYCDWEAVPAPEAELRRPESNRKEAASRLERLTPVLRAAGAIGSHVHPVIAIAGCLGPPGAAALKALRA